MQNASDIKKALTGKRIATRVGVSEQAVGNCKETFPAGWYPAVRELCAEAGIDCPLAAFNWAKGVLPERAAS